MTALIGGSNEHPTNVSKSAFISSAVCEASDTLQLLDSGATQAVVAGIPVRVASMSFSPNTSSGSKHGASVPPGCADKSTVGEEVVGASASAM